MGRRIIAILVAVLCSVTARAQTVCETAGCAYGFSKAQEGYFPDWVEVSPLDVNWLDVRHGVGHMDVMSNGPTFYQDNHAHVLWGNIGWGYPAVDAVLRFTGDNERTGWVEKFADGRSDPRYCHPLTHAPRASDELLVLTLYDDGASFIGAFIGGDMLPLGFNLPMGERDPLNLGFAVMGIVQLTAGDTQPRILDYTTGPPIRMGGDDLHLHLEVAQGGDGWTVAAEAHEDGGTEYTARASAAPPNIRGLVGLVGITGAKPYCIYETGGEFNREFEVSHVFARYQ
jgi:hypothetical protein